MGKPSCRHVLEKQPRPTDKSERRKGSAGTGTPWLGEGSTTENCLPRMPCCLANQPLLKHCMLGSAALQTCPTCPMELQSHSAAALVKPMGKSEPVLASCTCGSRHGPRHEGMPV